MSTDISLLLLDSILELAVTDAANEVENSEVDTADAVVLTPDAVATLAVLVASALVLVLVAPLPLNKLAPAVTTTGRYVISDCPSVVVINSVVWYPLIVWLIVHTAAVVPDMSQLIVSNGWLFEKRPSCIVDGPPIAVTPSP